MNDWSMLRKLIWLHVISGGGSSGARTTVTGVSPLALANALAKPIRSLIQYGKVTTSNGEMYCNNGKLVAVGDELSVVGTPEVLTVGEQTATVENLLAVDDIKDEQNIISGTVTRRCEAVISDGTTPSGRYIGEVGDGNIIVKVRETGYEGDVATFEADRAKPLNGLTVNVEPIQAGSGDPSPDNVRPISGRTSATVTRTGRNLLNPADYLFNERTQAGLTYTVQDDGSIHVTGTATSVGGPGLTGNIEIPNGTYNWRNLENSENVYFLVRKRDKASGATSSVDPTFTADGTFSIYVNLFCKAVGTYDLTIYPQLEVGSTATAFEPYKGNTYTIQLGETVYGGTLDVTQGKMVVTHMLFNRNSATMNNSNEYPGWNDAGLKALGYTGSRSGINTLLNIGSEFSYNCDRNNDILFFGAFAYNKTQEEWKALALDIQIVIPLVTPIEITLTPTQIDMLLGENNLWSDAGTVKAYVADGDVIEHVTAQPLRTVEGSNTVSVTSAVAPVQLEVKYVRGE